MRLVTIVDSTGVGHALEKSRTLSSTPENVQRWTNARCVRQIATVRDMPPDDERTTLRAFDGLAAIYDRHRPRYPPAIFERMLAGLPSPADVADVGCGTGISARALAEHSARVVGIDPGEDMLTRARERCATWPTIRFQRGTAEATGLDDASMDLVLAAQAFHWFDHDKALREFHRVLRPGGRCAMLWNLRVNDGGFTDRYNRIVVSAAEHLDPSARSGRDVLAEPLHRSQLFRDVEVITVPSPQTLDEAGIVGRATSASYFPREEPERSSRLAALRDAFAEHATNGFVTLRQDAQLTIATKA